jgi:hypothetical protein
VVKEIPLSNDRVKETDILVENYHKKRVRPVIFCLGHSGAIDGAPPYRIVCG